MLSRLSFQVPESWPTLKIGAWSLRKSRIHIHTTRSSLQPCTGPLALQITQLLHLSGPRNESGILTFIRDMTILDIACSSTEGDTPSVRCQVPRSLRRCGEGLSGFHLTPRMFRRRLFLDRSQNHFRNGILDTTRLESQRAGSRLSTSVLARIARRSVRVRYSSTATRQHKTTG
jgi:hypothetical protein